MLHAWRVAAALCLAATLGCAAELGPYVWARDYREKAPEQRGYVISSGDIIQVRMFGQEAFTTRARVRADGKVSLPLLNDVDAAGYTPLALGQQLETRYKDFVKVPAITISVEEVRPLSVPVAGEVTRPGIIAVDRGATLLQVLLLAGGPNDFAHKDRIFVLRGAPEPTRIRFTWEALLRGESTSARFEMAPGDTVVVE